MYKQIELKVIELIQQKNPIHKHHFFELIFVLEGSGLHIINNNKYSFTKGDVFFLTPEEYHAFETIDSCKLCFIDFTANFFSSTFSRRNEKLNLSDFFKNLEFVFHNHHNIHGSIVNENDNIIFEALIKKLISEADRSGAYQEIIVENIVFLLLNLLARNIHDTMQNHSNLVNSKSIIHEIYTYIQQNIYEKNSLKIESLALKFNKSADYINRYFKTQTGNTLKNYIIKYKLELIISRLKYSDLTISEIAYEMNFVDESHLNKIFKKNYGITANQYRLKSNHLE